MKSKEALAKSLTTPIETLVQLAEDEEVRSEALANPNMPVEILEQIAKQISDGSIADPYFFISKGIASNPNASERVLSAIGSKEAEAAAEWLTENTMGNEFGCYFLLTLAQNSNTPGHVLDDIASIRNRYWRNILCPSVASNPNAWSRTLEALATDEETDVSIRVAAIKNSNTPEDTRMELASSEKTAELLEALAEDEDYLVLDMLSGNINLPLSAVEKWANHENPDVRSLVVDAVNATEELLEKLANDEHWFVRASIAGDTYTPEHLLDKLAEDEDYRVAQSVADNEATPAHIQQKLAEHSHPEVRRLARSRSSQAC